MREKVVGLGYEKVVKYDEYHWNLLKEKREKAIDVMSCIAILNPIVHGSVARGDVDKRSDIDVVVPFPVPSFRIESILENSGYSIQSKFIVQATPKHTVKAQIVIDHETTVTFPIIKFSDTELDFYKFGGMLTLSELKNGRRTPGVDKRLVLIIPLKDGHRELSLLGNEKMASQLIGVDMRIIEERIRVLKRRDKIGRTGIYMKEEVPLNKSFESFFEELKDKDPAIRRMLRKRGVDV